MAFIEKRGYYKTLLILLICILFVLVIFAGTLGAARISFLSSLRIMIGRIPFVNEIVGWDGIKDTDITIVLNIRLPRIMLSAIVGAGLSVVGAAYQGLFKNPMADPYVLGISSGAAFGATLAIVLGFNAAFAGFGGITIFAFLGAIITTITVYSISRIGSRISTVHLLLAGISVSFMLSSLISVLMIFNREDIEKIVLWTMGSVSAAGWMHVLVLLPIVAGGSIIIYLFSRDLNIMLMGDEAARSMGIEVEGLKKNLMVLSSLIVAAIVSVSGIIGFVGLIIPHTIRIFFGADHRVIIPFSAISGAIFLIICDTLARSLVPPIEMPLGAITALFGAPYFIYLLIKSKKKVIQ